MLRIYKLAWRGGLTRSQIASRYGVSVSTITSIKHGDNWAHVTGHRPVYT